MNYSRVNFNLPNRKIMENFGLNIGNTVGSAILSFSDLSARLLKEIMIVGTQPEIVQAKIDKKYSDETLSSSIYKESDLEPQLTSGSDAKFDKISSIKTIIEYADGRKIMI
jgi:hypothetical protein